MATVPPADRTSPTLDPRYDPMYQRGYSAPGASMARRTDSRILGASPHPTGAAQRDPDSAPAPLPTGAQASAAQAAPATAPRLRTAVLWTASVVLVVLGVFLHFAFGASTYGAGWSASTADGSIRFADGRSVEQVLATQLAIAVAPYLVVLGVATAVATLFLHVLRSPRGTR